MSALQEHVKEMLNFIRYNLAINGMETSSQTLLSIIEHKLKSRLPTDPPGHGEVHFRNPPPKPLITPEQWDPKNLVAMPAVELARQLCLLGTRSLGFSIKFPVYETQWIHHFTC